jgi:hypothetical protein
MPAPVPASPAEPVVDIVQGPTRSDFVVAGLLAGPAAAVGLLLATAVTWPSPATLMSRSGILAGLGIAAWLGLFVIPVVLRVTALAKRRSVRVTRHAVDITRRTPLGTTRVTVPVAHYLGIAHIVRTASAGVVHEVVLVHENPAYDVVVAHGERIGQATIESIRATYDLAEIEARQLLAPRILRRLGLVTPQTKPISAQRLAA